MKQKRPINPELFHRCRDKLFEVPALTRIDAVLKFQCQTMLKAYYGGYLRAGAAMIWMGIRYRVLDVYWNFVFRFSDFIGWTYLSPIKHFPGHFERHGRYCNDLENCTSSCIESSVPRWYRKLTFWDDDNVPDNNERNHDSK